MTPEKVRILARFLANDEHEWDEAVPWLLDVADAMECPVMVTSFQIDREQLVEPEQTAWGCHLPARVLPGRTQCSAQMVTPDTGEAIKHLQSCFRHPLAMIKIGPAT